MKYIITCFVLLLCFGKTNAQTTYQILYGSTDTYAKLEIAGLQQTADSGFIATGFTFSYGIDGKIFLLKTNADGTVKWFKAYYVADSSTIVDSSAQMYPSNAFSVKQTKDGGYIVAGRVFGVRGGVQDVYILKTDGNGNVQWQKIYGGDNDKEDEATSILQTDAGEYVVAGNTHWLDTSYRFISRIYALKLTANGDIIWTNTFQTSTDSRDEASAIIETKDKNYVVCGATAFGSLAEKDALLIKIDAAAGSVLWSKAYGSGSAYATGTDVKQTVDGRFIITGAISENFYSQSDAFLLNVDVTGNTVKWAKSIVADDSTGEAANAIAVAADGGFAVYGNISYYPSGYQYELLVKTDNNGNVSWSNRYGGGSGFGFGKAIVQTPDEGFLLGSFQNIDFGYEGSTGHIIKTDALGRSGCYDNALHVVAAPLQFAVKKGATATGSINTSAIAFVSSANQFLPLTILCQTPAPELKFISFNGQNINNKNVLKWKTISELKSDHYEVEKSTDNKNFLPIGRVNAAFKTFSKSPYTFTDDKLLKPVNYYRITAVRSNRSVAYSSVVAIKTNGNNLITVSNTNIPGIILVTSAEVYNAPYVEYNIFNSSGNKVYTGRFENSYKQVNTAINLSFLQTGFYNISFSIKEAVANQKFIIAH